MVTPIHDEYQPSTTTNGDLLGPKHRSSSVNERLNWEEECLHIAQKNQKFCCWTVDLEPTHWQPDSTSPLIGKEIDLWHLKLSSVLYKLSKMTTFLLSQWSFTMTPCVQTGCGGAPMSSCTSESCTRCLPSQYWNVISGIRYICILNLHSLLRVIVSVAESERRGTAWYAVLHIQFQNASRKLKRGQNDAYVLQYRIKSKFCGFEKKD